MPRYRFRLQKDNHEPETSEADLPNLAAVQGEAVAYLAEQMKDHPNDLWNDEEWNVEVADESGMILFRVYSAAVKSSALGG